MSTIQELETLVEVELVSAPTLSFAMEQSGVPILKDVRLRNQGKTALSTLKLELQLVPDLADPYLVALPTLNPGEEVSLGVIDYRLPPGRLRSVTETERAQLTWRVLSDEETVCSGAQDVDVLAFNHWPGSRGPEGLLASFVMPNHPAIGTVLLKVRERLAATTGDNALEGYQTRSPERVAAMVQALYEAVQAMGISYAEVPASFERHGQKIRLPDALLRDQMGCCLDLTVLFAACLEQMGLNPLVIVVQGHAFPAVWTVDDRFPEGLIEDAARLRNAIALGQVVAFDSSTAVADPPRALGHAISVARGQLSDEAFVFALDMRVMRLNGFRPLPLRQATQQVDETEEAWPSPLVEAIAPPSPEQPSATEGPALDDIGRRFQRWQEKLLDLSLRNKLLNFNLSSKAAVPLNVPDIAAFEDLLAQGQTLDILPPPVAQHHDERDADLVRKRLPAAELQAFLTSDLQKGIIHSPMSEEVLLKSLQTLDRTARADFEEGGANTLFMAIGILKWFESSTSTTERFAPLLLYPVTLEYDRARRRMRVRRQPEDPIPNVTLVEKLRRDHGVELSSLLSLENDDSGVDIPRLLQGCRLAIQRQARWEVLDEAHLGLFSFTKFLMWKDLQDNAAQLLKSEVVRHVASREARPFAQEVAEITPEHLDAELTPDQVPCVIDADSTQMAAIASALAGRSFVLQGPPGTGKSQTITNLIAALLAAGKRVLFVSEKMAALEVVHRRLADVGLGDFCLELHSHKSNKKDVLESLAKTLNRANAVAEVPWEARAKEVTDLRHKLNVVAAALHRPHPIGMTFHQAVDRLMALSNAPQVRFPIPKAQDLTEERLRTWRERVRDFSERCSAVEPAARNPWAVIQVTDWSARVQEDVSDALEGALQALTTLERIIPGLESLTGIVAGGSTDTLQDWTALLSCMSSGPVPPAALSTTDWSELEQGIRRYLENQQTYDERRDDLLKRWSPTFLELEAEGLHSTFEQATGLFAFFKLMGPKRQLKPLALGSLGSNENILSDLSRQRNLRAERNRLTSERQALASRLSPLWDGNSGSLADLEQLMSRGHQVQVAVKKLESVIGKSLGRLPELALTPQDPQLNEIRDRLSAALDALKAAESTITSLLGIPAGKSWPAWSDPTHRSGLRATVESWIEAMPRFRHWCLYRQAANQLAQEGLEALAEAHLQGSLSADQLEPAFERNVLQRWTTAVRDEDEALLRFDGPGHERTAARFATLDQELLKLARQWVVGKLEQRLPNLAGVVTDSSEPGILQREIKKKARHMPVRKLLQTIPNLVSRLKPCFMMSPMSIAQYLPAEAKPFDVVVFDEASQIGTHDAIGAISRGSQVIVVGDSKQLPPTAFFQRQTDDDSLPDENDVVELESILDEMTAKQLPQQMLGWHYRSRHDSLIDFSNRHYYEGKLHIFPAASLQVEGLGIKWHPVPDGVYLGSSEGSQAGTNPKEAGALVAHLVSELRCTPAGGRTYGVVTFNQAQQSLILDLLDEQRARYPEIEPHFTGSEHVFVKNLENVQGDERDEIYFSICYARDRNGKLRMHFGPLSNSGGERRLNVAVTRARCQLRIFSTLTFDQIDLSRTNSVGTSHLRQFLQFAARQGSTEGLKTAQGRPPQGNLEREIRAAIEALGYEAHSQIGCGDYRIDLAVLSPDEPGVYFLGIETDGPNYRSGKTARDRDRLRSQVLKSLGWRLHRVWALDWWQDGAQEQARLAQAIEAALADIRAPKPEPEPIVSGPVEAPDMPLRESSATLAASSRPAPGRTYEPVSLAPVSTDPEAFYLPSATAEIRERLRLVVESEGPVHLDLAARRVMVGWGLTRLTDRVRRRVSAEISKLAAAGTVGLEGDFLWPKSIDPESMDSFRTAYSDGTTRDAEHLPPEEVAAAATWILSNCLSLGKDEAVREIAKLFGISRVGKNVASAMEQGIELLVKRSKCEMTDQEIRWLS